jgi:hypothetical protein
MNPRYALVSARAEHRCEYCHAPEAIFNFPFEVEHVFPPGQAGSDTEENWALACRSCNLFKSDGLDGTDSETAATIALFHPRHEVWEENFAAVVEEGTVIGLTPTGRATVARLRMNSPTQVFARKQWTRLGLFP